MEHVYVDENVKILRGDAARDALEKANDGQYLDPVHGVVQVSAERWATAQKAETVHQMTLGGRSGDDRNYDHYEAFDRYNALNGAAFACAIELGCGPFTNLRLIANACRIGACDLLDPLIEKYLAHRHVSFSRQRLLAEIPFLVKLPKYRVIKKAIRRIRGLDPLLRRFHTVPINRLLAQPIEEMPCDRQYDLVVMINVMEHCYDAEKIFDRILAISRSGTVLVFQGRCYKTEAVKKMMGELYDAAHPLRVDGRLIKAFLADNFREMFRRESSIDSDRGELHYIGRRV